MIKTGSEVLDEFLQGYKQEITIIYGPAASGKTTLAKLATIEQTNKGNKVVFIDTEEGFSVERFMQLAGWSYLDLLDKILLLKVNNFEDQCKKIEMLKDLIGIDLVIVDGIGKLYRKELKKDVDGVNKALDKQFKVLSSLTRKGVHVIITDQVYSDIETNEIKMVGGAMVENWAKTLIELQKEPRKIILKKPKEKEMDFRIEDKGIFKE